MKTIFPVVALLMLTTLKVSAQETNACKWEFPQSVYVSETSEPDYGVKITCSCPLKSVKITVYNRWGVEVYSTDQLEHIWQGKNTQEGVYMIIATGKYTNGDAFKQTASVNYFK